MRKELSDAITKLFSTPLGQPQPLADNEISELESTINLVVRMRGATARAGSSANSNSSMARKAPAASGCV